MFGDTVDYSILKPLTHSRNRATEEQLASTPAYTLDEARAYLDKACKLYFGSILPIDPRLSYLDLGCGTGQLSIGLTLSGVEDVTGIDIVDRNVGMAKKVADQLPADARPRFLAISSHEMKAERRYDVVIALAVMEHVDNPALLLREIRDLLKPDGRAFVSMTPFHGPFGDHMRGFFKVQIPWRGPLFSEKALLRLRGECFRPDDLAERYRDVGLNLMTVGELFRYIDDAELYAEKSFFDPHFRRYRRLRPFYPLSWILTRIPKVRDYFTFNVYSILRRRDRGAAPDDYEDRPR